jgi:hypothetical protein
MLRETEQPTLGGPIRPGLARCQCLSCGVHSNAVAAHHVFGSCPNCGASLLEKLEGADVIRGAEQPQPAVRPAAAHAASGQS